MKKILFAIAIVFMVSFGARAQYFGNDNLFNDWNDIGNGLDKFDEYDDLRGGGTPGFPGGHGTGNTQAPLGSGLVVLTALGAGYAMKKRQREE